MFEGPDGILLATGEDAGLFSIHMTSNQHISSVMLEVKMILVKKRDVPRSSYYGMVTQYDLDFLGDVLYHDIRFQKQREKRHGEQDYWIPT
jgi:hypothetical protein